MAASSTWTQPSISNVSCASARCSGFAKVRGKNDFAFVLETEWSDCRKQCVKRTFEEFQIFHSCLTKAFPDLKRADRKVLSLRSGIKDLFTQDRRRLAEIREPIIDAYLRDLTTLPEKVSRSSLVLTFLEPRDSDPKPVKACGDPDSPSDGAVAQQQMAPGALDGRLPKYASSGGPHSWKAYRDWCVATVLKTLQPDNAKISSGPGYCGEKNETSATRIASSPDGDRSSESDNIDENYFLNVGVQDLMLSDNEAVTATSKQPDSMWCSDFEKFSEILRDNMSAFPLGIVTRRHSKMMELTGFTTAGDMTESSYHENCTEDADNEECSDTESQLMERSYYVDNDVDSDLQSDDEFAAADQGSCQVREIGNN